MNFTGINYGILAVSGSGIKTLGAVITTTNVASDSIRVYCGILSTNNLNIACPNNRSIVVDAGATGNAGSFIITFGNLVEKIFINGPHITTNGAGFSGQTLINMSSINSPSI